MLYTDMTKKALTLLTHDDAEPYLDYVARLKGNANLRHNSDLTRLDVVGEKDLERVRKYAAAIKLLTDEPDGAE